MVSIGGGFGIGLGKRSNVAEEVREGGREGGARN